MTHLGVRNRTDEEQIISFDNRPIRFAKGQVKILSDVPAGFIETRYITRHQTKKSIVEGVERVEILNRLENLKCFEIIPLAEALKVAAPEEDPQVIAEREKLQAEQKKEDALLARFQEKMLATGWKAPEAEKSLEKSKGGK